MDEPSPARRVRAAIHQASAGLVERDVLAELIALSAVAGEHLLVIGPPGTGKSEVVRRVTRAVGGRYFEYLLGRFTEPSEIFGPVDLRKLKDGVVETETRNMLPEAEIAFLDEVFLGSTAILNTLLAVLNERVFRRGHTVHACPLRVCVGASNALPEDETLAAFADRFLCGIGNSNAVLRSAGPHRLPGHLGRRPTVLGAGPELFHKPDVATRPAVADRHRGRTSPPRPQGHLPARHRCPSSAPPTHAPGALTADRGAPSPRPAARGGPRCGPPPPGRGSRR